MKVAVSGATGLVGRALVARLLAAGHEVTRLVRRQAGDGEVAFGAWGDVAVDAIVHLAGEPVAQRWTADARARIISSRVDLTRKLATDIAAMPAPPKVVVSASAIGIYGSTEREVDETSPRGLGFLADVGVAWEGAIAPVVERGCRLVNLRLGLVLSVEGGLLAGLRPVVRLGLAGPVGSGTQGMSWIARDDLVSLIMAALVDDRYRGPVNGVAPGAVSQREFIRAYAASWGRPAWIPAPAFAVATLMGEMGREMLLGGAVVRPTVASRLGFQWRAPDLATALRNPDGP